MATLTTDYADEFFNLLLNLQTQPTIPTAAIPRFNLTVAGAPVANISPVNMEFDYNTAAPQAALNIAEVIIDTSSVVGDHVIDGFELIDSAGATIVTGGAPDNSITVNLTKAVVCAINSIGGGILPQVDGYSSQAEANTTAWGEFYLARFMGHYLGGAATWAGSPSNVWVSLHESGAGAGELGLSDYTTPPIVPGTEWSATGYARQALGGARFDFTTEGAARRATLNGADVVFSGVNPNPDKVASIGLWDAVSGGNLIAMSDVNPDQIVADGDDVIFPAASIWFEVNTGG